MQLPLTNEIVSTTTPDLAPSIDEKVESLDGKLILDREHGSASIVPLVSLI